MEVIAALGKKVRALQNKGPDILLSTGERIELKAATDFNPRYLRDGSTKYNTPCIFLADGRDRARIKEIGGNGVELVAHEVFSDGVNEWVIGVIAPDNRSRVNR